MKELLVDVPVQSSPAYSGSSVDDLSLRKDTTYLQDEPEKHEGVSDY